MPRDNSGNYTAPVGTTAVPGNLITDTEFNNFVADIANEMTASARESELRDLGGALTTTTASGGTAGVNYALTLNTPWTSLGNGLAFSFRAHTANTGPCTITINSVRTGVSTAFPLRATSGVDLSSGDIATGAVVTGALSLNSFNGTFTANLTLNSNQATSASSTSGLVVGQAFTSTTAGIPSGTTITAISGSTITLSAPFSGTTTTNASCTVTGPEVLLLNGALLATAAKLATAGGIASQTVSSDTVLATAQKGKLLLATSTLKLSLSAATSLGSGWYAYVQNKGAGDVTLQVNQILNFTGSATNGSNQITSASSTTGLAVGQTITGSTTAIPFTATPYQGLVAALASSATGLAVGQLLSSTSPGVPYGTTIASIVPSSFTFTTSVSGGSPTFTASSASGLAVGQLIQPGGVFATPTYITAISGTSITVNTNATSSSSITVTVPVQVLSSNAFTAPTPGTVTFTAAAGFAPNSTITAISGTTLTLSSTFSAPTTVGASFTATSDLVDGLTSYVIYPGEVRLLQCDGSTIRSSVLTPFFMQVTASRQFTMPPGYTGVGLDGIGGGGGGGGGNLSNPSYLLGGGGGGGGRYQMLLANVTAGSSQPILIGAGGSAGAIAASGSAGGATVFGQYATWTGGGAGGAPGTYNGTGGNGGGSGITTRMTGQGIAQLRDATGFAGGYGGNGTGAANFGGCAEWGGAGGGGGDTAQGAIVGGSSLFGGGGGGAGNYTGGRSGTTSSGGGAAPGSAGANATSVLTSGGGGGGGASASSAGGAGGIPGGGGGGGYGNASGNSAGGAGARGELRIWGY